MAITINGTGTITGISAGEVLQQRIWRQVLLLLLGYLLGQFCKLSPLKLL
jgi:hypothetical protein